MRNHQSHVSNPAAPAPEDGYDDVRSAASSSDSSHHPPTPPFAREKMMVMAARSPLVSAENHPALGGQHQQQQPSPQQQQQLHPQQQPQPQPGIRTGHPSHANSPSARRNSRSETRARAPYLSAAGAPRTLSDHPPTRPPPASRAVAIVPQRQLSNSAAASSSSSRGSRAVNRWIGMAREGEAEREEARVSADGGGGGSGAAAAAAAAVAVAIVAPDHDDDQTENGDPATAGSLLVATADKKRRYPRTRRGGYAPAHLRQQFCSIDHPRDHPDGEPPDDDRAGKVSLLSRLLGLRPKPKPKKKRPAASLLSSSSSCDREGGERRGGRDGVEREDEEEEEEDPRWWGWEIRATYQPALTSGPDGAPSRDSIAVSPHIEFRLRARRDVTLRELIVWGVAWRTRRRGRDSFGTYDGCDRHPDRALGRWGRMAERRATYGNAISTGAAKAKGGAGAKRGRRWTARVSVVHEDAAWLEKVNPAALVKLEDANTIEIYDLSGEMCFVLDAHTNQYWVLNDAIPEDKGQWIGDNVWNVVHGYDEEA